MGCTVAVAFEDWNAQNMFGLNTKFLLLAAILTIVAFVFVENMSGHTPMLIEFAFVAAGFSATVAVVVFIRQIGMKERKVFLNATMKIAENMDTIAFVTGRTGKVTYANGCAIREFGPANGKPLEEFVGKEFPESLAFLKNIAAQSVKIQTSHEQMTIGQNRLRIRTFPMPHELQLWILQKLTANQMMQNAFMQNRLPMYQCDRAGQIIITNEALDEKLGFSPVKTDQMFYSGAQSTSPIRLMKSVDGVQSVQLFEIEKKNDYSMVLVIPQVLASKIMTNWSSLDDLPVAILRLDTKGIVAGSNSLASHLLDMDNLIGQPFAELVEGLGRPIDDWVEEHISGRSVPKPEIVMSRQSAGDRYLQVTLDIIHDQGEVFVIAVMNDATELKTLEAQFVQSQKMQAVGQLAGGVAHDFNNLLTAISGYCDLLLLRHDPDDQDFADLQQIAQNANRAASLVGQLLAFSRKQNLRPEVLDLRETLADLTHLLNRLVGENIRLTQSIDSDVGFTRADKRQLEQVIMNLVVNARDAIGEGGGEIQIKTRHLRLKNSLTRDRATVPAGEYMVVRVADTGCGIAPDFLTKVFEPFVTTKRTGEGTGLGLSMVYGIIKQTGGFVFVDSIVGQGSEFSLYLPACEAEPEGKPEPVDAPVAQIAPTSGGVVLLVEDEAPVRAFASRALRMRGFKVLEADSAEAALETLEDQDLHVDVFVSDVVMPGMDGPTWVEIALQTRPDARVIFVSGYAKESFTSQQARTPQSTFLSKPYSLADLTECVQNEMQ